jgi:hypothetical protein
VASRLPTGFVASHARYIGLRPLKPVAWGRAAGARGFATGAVTINRTSRHRAFPMTARGQTFSSSTHLTGGADVTSRGVPRTAAP